MRQILSFILIAFQYNRCCAEHTSITVNKTTAYYNVTSIQMPMPRYAASTAFQTDSDASTRNRVVSVLASINFSGNTAVGPICTESMELALDRLRMKSNWLPGYELVIELIDDRCEEGRTVTEAVNAMNNRDRAHNRMPFFVVSMCSIKAQAYTAALVRHYDMLAVAINQGPKLDKKTEQYRNFYGLCEKSDSNFQALASFLLKMNWRRVAIISELHDYFNALDQTVLALMEKQNITVEWIGKVNYNAPDQDLELETEFKALALRKPRIIIGNTNQPIVTACWLHRLKLYGPNYVILFSRWSYFLPQSAQIPKRLKPWCSASMLGDVFQSTFFFGQSTMADLFGDETTDSTGMHYSEYIQNMRTKVDRPEQMSTWYYWKNRCYDQVIFIGAVLNATETELNGRNQTLLDYVGSATKASLLTETVRSNLLNPNTKVRGFNGEYHFDANSEMNSGGYIPITFEQGQKGPSGFQSPIVAYFKSNNKVDPIQLLPGGKLKWRTSDAKPPKDHVTVVNQQVASFEIYEVIILMILAVVEIAVIVVLLFFIMKKKLSTSYAQVLIGSAFIVGQNFLLPFDVTSNVARYCTSIAYLITFGFSIAVAAISLCLKECQQPNVRIRLDTFRMKRFNSPISPNGARTNSAVSPPDRKVTIKTTQNQLNRYWKWFPLFWAILHLSLLVAWMTSSKPIQTMTVTTEATVLPYDSSLAVTKTEFHCKMVLNTASAMGYLGSMIILQSLILFNTAFQAYTTTTIDRNHHSKNFRLMRTCLYGQILVICAGVLIALLLADSFHNLQITISVITLFIGLFNIIAIGYATLHH